MVGVLGDQRPGARAHVLVLRPRGHARDQVGERLGVQQRVGVDRHHDRRRHVDERRVERVVLAGLGLEAAPIVEPQPRSRGRAELGGPVRRVVVGQHDRERARILGRRDVVERRLDRRLLVVRRHDHGHRRPLAGRPRARGRVERRRPVAREEQRHAQEADHHARDVREQHRDHPRHDRAERVLEFGAPGLREPDREGRVRERQRSPPGEPHRRTDPERRALAGRRSRRAAARRPRPGSLSRARG